MTDKEEKRLQLYLEDSREQLEGIENDFLLLEQSGANMDEDLINRIFRSIHSIKGGAAFLGLKEIKDLSHVTEDVLNEIRNGNLTPSQQKINVLLTASDALRTMIEAPDQSGNMDNSQLIQNLESILDGSYDESAGGGPKEGGVSIGTPEFPDLFSIGQQEIDEYLNDGFSIYIANYQYSVALERGDSSDTILENLDSIGYILSHTQKPESSESPFLLLIASVLEKEIFSAYLELPLEKVFHWTGEEKKSVAAAPPSPLEQAPNSDSEDLDAPDWAHPIEAQDPSIGVFPDSEFPTLPASPVEETPAFVPRVDFEPKEPEIVETSGSGFVPTHATKPPETSPLPDPPTPELRSFGSPESPSFDNPEPPSFDNPEPPSFGNPEPPSFGNPEPPSFSNPEPPERETVVEREKPAMAVAPRKGPVQAQPERVERRSETRPESAAVEKKESTSSTIRVNVDILDSLMNLAGELVLTRNQLNQTVEVWDKYSIELAAQRLDSVTSELQESIMSTRMQPIGIVFNKFQRVVRDMSRKLGKSIDLHIEGDEVELDKTIIENIGDPLTHLVRNAIDHGIETPTKRRRAGKPDTGTLKLVAKHEAGHVIIEIVDDGGGIDAAMIRDKALEKGLVEKAKLDDMPDKEVTKLIFSPGFSTAQEISDISGRGVGMDVVLTNLTQLGGSIDINTKVGKGTTFKIKLPLTLAIIPSLLINVNKDTYAIPQVNLVELVRIPPEQVKKRLEQVGGALVIRLRGKLLPLVRLQDFLGIDEGVVTHPDTLEEITERRQNIIDRRALERPSKGIEYRRGKDRRFRSTSSVNIVVVSAGEFRYGIIVDNLMDSEEIVVKPLGFHIRDCLGYAGATILGDGTAALIIDVVGVAKFMELKQHEQKELEAEELLRKAQESAGDNQNLLIIENGEDEQFAVQLAFIHRIERINASTIQKVGDKAVTQYRGGALLLFALEDALQVKPRKEGKHVYLILFSMHGKEVAIMASNIVDIVDVSVEIDKTTFKQKGVVGSSIILEKITLYLDLFGLVKKQVPEWDEGDDAAGKPEHKDKYTVLVVEDTPFFRDHIQSIFEESGFDVILANDGKQGIDTLYKNINTVDLILSDVEMPVMDGIEMVGKIREDSQFDRLSILMLTSLSSEQDVKRAKSAGADEYLVKIDQEQLIRVTKEKLGLL